MDLSPIDKLWKEGIISDQSHEKIKAAQSEKIHFIQEELNIILYVGVLLTATGLGILVYEHIDSIGHTVILAFIAALSAGGFFYCYLHKSAFSRFKVDSPNLFVDYILVLSCLCFLIFLGYWQYQYRIFGDRFGLGTFIPMVILFFTAYFFDHLGVLSLGIINLAAWAGVVVTPTKMLKANDFNSSGLIFTGLALGLLFLIAGWVSRVRQFKAHFNFTYNNFGMNMLFIFCLAGMFHFDSMKWFWLLALTAISIFFYFESIRTRSFYYLLMDVLYFYIGISYIFISLPLWNYLLAGPILFYTYFILSAFFLVRFLIHMNGRFKS